MSERRGAGNAVSIGRVLSDARCRSGLSISEVSRRTRIREPVIWSIELEDFSQCGGDFYARGHIRAIAAAVRVDPAPLIAEYDAVHAAHDADHGPALLALRPPDPVGRDERLRRRHRHRVAWVTALCLVVLAIFGGEAYHFASTGNSAHHAAQAAFNRSSASHHSQHAKPSPSPAKPSPSPASTHSTAPAPSAAPVTVTPSWATAYGPWGVAGDNPQDASLAIDNDPSTAWHTQEYSTSAFGHLKAGTGLLLYLGRRVTITSAHIVIGAPGARVELRAGLRSSPTDLQIIGVSRDAGRIARIHPEHIRARYLLIWFTNLPRNASGSYEASVYHITLQGLP